MVKKFVSHFLNFSYFSIRVLNGYEYFQKYSFSKVVLIPTCEEWNDSAAALLEELDADILNGACVLGFKNEKDHDQQFIVTGFINCIGLVPLNPLFSFLAFLLDYPGLYVPLEQKRHTENIELEKEVLRRILLTDDAPIESGYLSTFSSRDGRHVVSKV